MTAAGGKLATSVTLRDLSNGFKLVTFAAGDTPPAWAAALIKNPKAWESAQSAPTPEGGEDEVPTQPEDDADGGQGPEAPVGDLGSGPAPEAEEDLIGTTESPAPAPEAQTPEATEGGAAPKPSLPPKRGSGSGKDAWAKYADAWGIKYAATATRDDIIELVEAAPDVPSDQ